MKQTRKTQPKAELRHVTIRINVETYKSAQSLADEFHVPVSEVFRLAIDSSLEKYLGTLRYVDQEDARVINRNLINIYNLLTAVRDELRHQGVNINQIARLRNAEKKKQDIEEQERNALKYKLSSITINKILDDKEKIEQEIESITNDKSLLSKEEYIELIDKVENIVKQAGELLWKLQL